MKNFIAIISILFAFSLHSQELNCDVNVTSNPALDITTDEKDILRELQNSIENVMNETSWTNEDYEIEERINCVMEFSITEVSGGGNYRAQLQIQATRPVYNTTYNTTIINVMDREVAFNYRRGTKITFSENQYSNNLSSILGFYAYYILGMDGDSFASKGGSSYLKKAQNVAVLAQSGGGSGWKSNDKKRRNRYWIIENALHEMFSPLRECMYEYHRNGLDQMYDNPQKGREEIANAVQKLLKINQTRPGSVNVENFMQAKRTELINLFEDAERKDKTDAVNLFKRLDPANASKYQEIL